MVKSKDVFHAHLLQGQLEERVDRLTAAILLNGASQQVFDQLETLHRIVKDIRQHLKDQERHRTMEQLTASIQQQKQERQI